MPLVCIASRPKTAPHTTSAGAPTTRNPSSKAVLDVQVHPRVTLRTPVQSTISVLMYGLDAQNKSDLADAMLRITIDPGESPLYRQDALHAAGLRRVAERAVIKPQTATVCLLAFLRPLHRHKREVSRVLTDQRRSVRRWCKDVAGQTGNGMTPNQAGVC